MSQELENLIAQRFIARLDVKAIQHTSGAYAPDVDKDGNRIPWSRAAITSHLAGIQTYGHYVINKNDECKLFIYDIDLEQTGWLPTHIPKEDEPYTADIFTQCSPRECWRQRNHPGRVWMKQQFRYISHSLMAAIQKELGLPCAAAYSGSKGVHVYGFTGLMPALEVRTGAEIVLDALDCFKPRRGNSFFVHTNADPVDGFPNISIEVYPKQTSLDGKDLGNLVRLPLGKNHKSSDPTFFIDQTQPLNVMQPVDPVFALTTENPWERSPM